MPKGIGLRWAKRCNGGIAAAIVLKSTTRASLMHEEHRRILVFKVEHEAEPATSFAESCSVSPAARSGRSNGRRRNANVHCSPPAREGAARGLLGRPVRAAEARNYCCAGSVSPLFRFASRKKFALGFAARQIFIFQTHRSFEIGYSLSERHSYLMYPFCEDS